jgi:hypothetical protein
LAAFDENGPPASAFDTPKNLENDACGDSGVGGLSTALGVAKFTSLNTLRAFTLMVIL